MSVYKTNASFFVKASAGSGKTKLLVDKFLSLLLAGVPAEKILCITYTKAAAHEMKSRIAMELEHWVLTSDETLAEIIAELGFSEITRNKLNFARALFAKLIDAQQDLKIGTIHSFSQAIIDKFLSDSNQYSQIKLIEEAEAAIYINMAKDKMLTYASESLQENLAYLSAYIGDVRLNNIFSDILLGSTQLNKLLSEKTSEQLIENLQSFLECQYTEESQLLKEFQDGNQAHRLRIAELTEDETYINLVNRSNVSPREFYSAYKAFFYTKTGSPRKKLFGRKIESKLLTELCMQEIAGIEMMDQLLKKARLFKLTSCFIIVFKELLGQYDKIKESHSVIDYNDIIIKAQNLTSDSQEFMWLCYRLNQDIDHILVDEAQDTSKDQWDIILNLLKDYFDGNCERPKSIFIVGDIKQSIYSFQGADIKVFSQIYDCLCKKSEQLDYFQFSNYRLVNSYRSVPKITEFIDRIFADNKYYLAIGELAPTMHIPVKSNAGSVKIFPNIDIDNKCEIVPWRIGETILDSQDNAYITAQRVTDFIEESILTGAAQPDEIMVLTRKRSDFVNYLTKLLDQRDIALAGLDRLNLTEHLIVKDLIAAANFSIMTSDDLNLAALLKSPLIGVTEQKLYNLAIARGDQTLYSFISKDDKELAEKLDQIRFAEKNRPINFFLFLLDNFRLKEKYKQIYGDLAEDVIEAFLDICLELQGSHSLSMQHFLKDFEKQEYQIKRDLGINNSGVRIMTIHGSKGLQAKMVIIVDDNSLPNTDATYLLDSETFILALNKSNFDRNCECLYSQTEKATYEEYLRLLYVALTRACDHLAIFTYGKDKEKSWGKILRNIAQEGEFATFAEIRATEELAL